VCCYWILNRRKSSSTRMQAAYDDQCVDVSTVRCWVRRFKDAELRQAYLSDRTRSGRPLTSAALAEVYWSAWSFCGKIIMQLWK
jgi:hypothetical protein